MPRHVEDNDADGWMCKCAWSPHVVNTGCPFLTMNFALLFVHLLIDQRVHISQHGSISSEAECRTAFALHCCAEMKTEHGEFSFARRILRLSLNTITTITHPISFLYSEALIRLDLGWHWKGSLVQSTLCTHRSDLLWVWVWLHSLLGELRASCKKSVSGCNFASLVLLRMKCAGSCCWTGGGSLSFKSVLS